MTESAFFASAAQKDCFNDLDVEQFEVVARDAEGHTYEVPADMTYKEWQEKFVADATPVHVESQFERYKSVLKDHCPQTLDEFTQIKYNDPERWAQLKYEYRTVNRYSVDQGSVSVSEILRMDNAAYYTKQHGFDRKLISASADKDLKDEMKNLHRSGNAATMQFENVTYFSHSAVGTSDDPIVSIYTGRYPLVELKEPRLFTVKDLGDDIPRQYDTEAKFLEFVADRKKGNPQESFTVTILSEKHICESCQGVVRQFEEMFPNATVNIVSGKVGYGKGGAGLQTWKKRGRKVKAKKK